MGDQTCRQPICRKVFWRQGGVFEKEKKTSRQRTASVFFFSKKKTWRPRYTFDFFFKSGI
jgi:hypothetical protein